jgi:hypothetical protein
MQLIAMLRLVSNKDPEKGTQKRGTGLICCVSVAYNLVAGKEGKIHK